MADLGVRWRSAYRRRERLWVAATLAAPVLLLAGLALGGWLEARGKVWFYGRLEHTLNRWDDRWLARVERGETMLAAGEFAAAADYLEALDRRFPARRAEHRRDKQRERLLRALAESHAGLDRKRRTLETYRRLVAFDPRNFLNHHDLARACIRFNEGAEAREHLERALRIHPTHQASLAAYVGLLWDAADYPGVVSAYERYRDAMQVLPVRLSAGDREDVRPLPADGEGHDLRFRLGPTETAPERGRLAVGPEPFRVEAIVLQPPLGVGAAPRPAVRLSADDLAVAQGSETGDALEFVWPAAVEADTVRVRLRAWKPLAPELAATIAKAYENVLHPARAAEVRRAARSGAAG